MRPRSHPANDGSSSSASATDEDAGAVPSESAAKVARQPRITVSDAIQRLKGTLIGRDGRTTTVVIILNKEGLVLRASLVQSIRELITQSFDIADADLHLAGPVVDGLTVDAAAHASLTHFAGPSALIILPFAGGHSIVNPGNRGFPHSVPLSGDDSGNHLLLRRTTEWRC